MPRDTFCLAFVFSLKSYINHTQSCSWYTLFCAVLCAPLCVSFLRIWYLEDDAIVTYSVNGNMWLWGEHMCFWLAQAILWGYLTEVLRSQNPKRNPSKGAWAAIVLAMSFLIVELYVILARDEETGSNLSLIFRLLAQTLTFLALLRAYFQLAKFRQEEAGDFVIFTRQACLGLWVLCATNLTEIAEQLVLWMRHSLSSKAEVQFFDVEIAVFLVVINRLLPVLCLLMIIPDWRERDQEDFIFFRRLTPYLIHGLHWFAFVEYFLWGLHMTRYPKDCNKANDGGWLFVIAKASAATLYFDIPVLFLTVWRGVVALLDERLGFDIQPYARKIHKWVAVRVTTMSLVHGMAHWIWWVKTGLHEYGNVMYGDDMKPFLPFETGTLMLVAMLAAVCVTVFWKKRFYDRFLQRKREAGLVIVICGLLHGDFGALGQPTLWAFLLMVLGFYILESSIHSALWKSAVVNFTVFEQQPDEDGRVVIVLSGFSPFRACGYIMLKLPGIPSWHPFTLAESNGGVIELHVSVTPSVGGNYANFSSTFKERALALQHAQQNQISVEFIGPFAGLLANQDLYERYQAVIFCGWGTGFAGCLQGLRAIQRIQEENRPTRVVVAWKGRNLQYYRHKVIRMCEEYRARDLLGEWRGIERTQGGGIWSADEFWRQVGDCHQHLKQQGSVLFAACGDPAVVAELKAKFERHDQRVIDETYGD